jgi:hypothetical protein
VLLEPLAERRNRSHVVTIVLYCHLIGPIYSNAIRPFHYLIVASIARAGVRGAPVHGSA